VAALLVGAFAPARARADDPPRGRRTTHRAPTFVVVAPTDLDAGGAVARLAPGVGVVTTGPSLGTGSRPSGRVAVTLAAPVEISGSMSGADLGGRLAADTELRSPDGATVLGRGRAGALLAVVGSRGRGFVCDTAGRVRARVWVPAVALTTEPRELVYPVAAEKVVTLAAPAELRQSRGGPVLARLDAAAQVVLLGGDAQAAHVRSYGPVEIEGEIERARLAISADAPVGEGKGLTPTHEALVDTPAYADAHGTRRVGLLRGGTLVTMGVEVDGPRVKVMTHGDVVVELWVQRASLRPLEPDIWSERD
jgi:hypothetical protein